MLDGRPNHDAPETHEASILIPSISSFSPSSSPPHVSVLLIILLLASILTFKL